jgi:eukaryotic-like serine/threonine-protein kinase
MDASGSSAAAGPPNAVATFSSALQAGRVLGNRYEILQLLGEGGMGAVYKARDREVDRFVALKIIRPELASRPDILARFKQELILARQVTHKNVIRIFDLGEADGMKFITMDFVEGRDLKTILRETGKFTPDAAVKIIAQICRALDAAHTEGVVHRDLKPQNIMVDDKGRVTVMDFGIARSLEMTGMTQTGSLVGTPEYMSPEQAKGEDVDARSDIFTVGIIFYELLTGKTPFHADTTYATLLKRTQERARPPIELDPTIPPQLSGVVMKCLETNREQRYSSALEIIHDLGQQTLTGSKTALPTVAPSPAGLMQRYGKLIAGGIAALVLISVGVIFRGRIFSGGKKAPAGPAISLAILPFHNASGDSSLDWLGTSLADMLQTDVGQSSSLHTVSLDRLHQVLNDLRITPDSTIDPSTLSRIGEFTNADRVVWGQYVKLGDQIRVDATLVDLKSQQRIPLKVEASGEKALLGTVDQLAKAIRGNLTLAPAAVEELKASAFTPSSKSVDALRDYSHGLDLSRQGNYLEAEKQFGAAVKEDQNFALAYAKLGQTYASLGYDKEAEQNSTKALDLSNDLPPAEKYWIQAANAGIVNNYPKAIEAYDNLSTLLPNDPQVQFDLGTLYESQGQFGPAHDHFAKALQDDPKYLDALLAVGRVEYRRGNAQGSLDYLNRALSLAVELDDKQEKANVQQTLGLSYNSLDKLDDALQNFQAALDLRKQIGDKRGQAASLDSIAVIQEAHGKLDQARSTYQEALKIQKDIGDKRGMGITLINLGDMLRSQGQTAEALDDTKQALQIEQDVGNQNNQALCLNNIGATYFESGRFDDALTYFKQSLDLRQKLGVPADIAMTLNNVGDTSAKMGHYDQALSSEIQALDLWRKADDKSGIATTSDSMSTLFKYQGRFGAALDAQQEAIKNLQQLQDRGELFAETQANYGNALSMVGRDDDARKNLDDAMALARQLKDTALMAKILNFQGDRLFYRGDLKGARPLYDQALEAASRAKDREEILVSKFNQAKLSVKEGHGGTVTGTLRGLAHDADGMGLKFLSIQCTVYLGEALNSAKDYSHARQELEGAIGTSENLGMRALLPQANYLLSLALRGSGDKSGADQHLQQAVKLLEDMHTESKSDALLSREDFRAIAEAGAHLSSK